jgi:hypothetical protein
MVVSEGSVLTVIEEPTKFALASAADGVRTRIADVLKRGLEHDLTAGAVEVAKHSDRIVVDFKVSPGQMILDDAELLVDWDDERFEKFAARLSERRNATGATA